MTNSIQQLKTILQDAANIVFFGGAGVSTESGIPDYRSADGLYNSKYAYPPETMLSYSFFVRQPSEFYRFYRDKMLYPDAQPNKAHLALAELEKRGKLKAVVTQNIDSLHSKAGSVNVLELHGSAYRNYCMDCKAQYPLETIIQAEDVPLCSCGGVIRPDVVLYEEGLDERVLAQAARAIRDAEVLMVGGTSLNVYPAAGLIRHYRGGKLILINKSETPYDGYADLMIRENIGETLGAAV
ncbi:MAG: NAD-dependent protein deacylase [Oscillospiraceae bacterium]|nr:NAD-dependent protein deacylase [Oscillospiraceae bacterium]